MPQPLIIIGATARAAAASAIKAGYQPWCIDHFADRDLRALAPVRLCPPGQYPAGILPLLAEAPVDAPVLLTGAMENHLDVVQAISFEHPLLSSPPDAMRQVRDPHTLASLPAIKGIRFPKVRTRPSLMGQLKRLAFGFLYRGQYLLKPIRSAGGIGIGFCPASAIVANTHYLQQFIRGIPLSAVFHADGWSAALLGVTEQLIGEPDFGATGFRYAGSIGPYNLSEKSRAALSHLGVVLAQRHDLRGLFGIDLVMDMRGRLAPVEVNPRYTASIEILEKANLTALKRKIEKQQRKSRTEPHRTHGKAIVFAKSPCRVGDLYDALAQDQVADVPAADARFNKDDPICTVFATAHTRDECYDSLVNRANRVYAALRPT